MKTETRNQLETVPGYETLKEDLRGIELDVLTEGYTLADAIREGSEYTDQKIGGFVNAERNEVCALSAAALAVQARFGG